MKMIARFMPTTHKSSKTFKSLRRWIQTNALESPKPDHIPVMVNEVVKNLNLQNGETFLDMTFGAGGHSNALLKKSPKLKIIALDRDPVAHEHAKKLQAQYPDQIIPLLGKFSDLPELLKTHGVKQNSIDGILFDLGCSSMQFDEGHRGFSISHNGPLDMRMDGPGNPYQITAADVVAEATEGELYHIFKTYGEEKYSRRIARELVEARYTFTPVQTTSQLAFLVDAVCSKEKRFDMLQRKASVATKIFQALRIFVNNEINELNYGMVLAHLYLKSKGRLVALSFHSLEDTVIKRHIQGLDVDNAFPGALPVKFVDPSYKFSEDDVEDVRGQKWKIVNKHVITPSKEEVEYNPRSRSAKLRCAVKI